MQLNRISELGKRLVGATAVAVAMAATVLSPQSAAIADTTSNEVAAPASSKTLTDNGDGTYDLTLSVTGAASSSTTKTKANVILVMDTSGSMNWNAQSATGRYASSNGGEDVATLYYERGGQYYELDNDDYTGTVYTRRRSWFGYDYSAYNGERFSAQTRLDVAKAASTNLVQTLAANNASSADDTVEISLVSFAGNANPSNASSVSWSKGNDPTALVSQINNLSATGGTNWDDGLHVAKAAADAKKASEPDEKTYIIFVSDGDPTFYMDAGHNNRQGSGYDDKGNDCYNAAAAEATAIKNAGYGFYAVGAFGNVNRMESLATAGGGDYYSAANTDDLNNAFASIISSITNAANFQNVKITDGITPATASTVLSTFASPSEYTYTITEPNGSSHQIVLNADGKIETVDGGTAPVTLTDIADNSLTLTPGGDYAAASSADGTVTWDLSDLGTLLNGYTYSVTFKVWPSQDAYDTVAKLEDGILNWDTLDEQTKSMFHREQQADGSYAYSLVTNTDAKVDYTAVQTQNGEVISSTNGTSTVESHPTITLLDTSMGVKKEWVGEHSDAPIEFALYVDGKDSGAKLTLSADNNWQGSIKIAPGLKVNGETLEEGHDYELVELNADSSYEFTSTVAHPMLVDSATNITDPAGNNVTLTATNVRKSTLDITKSVNNVTGGADANTEFTFDVTVSDAKVEDVTYQVVAADGTVGQDQTMKSGSIATIKIKAGEKIHFPALTTGSTYTVVEKDLPAGYSIDNDTQTGTIDEGDTAYTADFENTYQAASVTASFPVRKVLSTSDGLIAPNIAGKYTFTLSAADGTPLPATTTAVNPEATGGMAVFGDITYTMPGTYVYSVRESGTVAGVSNDSTDAKTVTVTVSDDGTGKLSAVASSTMDSPVTFTNTYSVGEVQATISVQKILESVNGDNLPDVTDKYTFTLTDAEGNEVGTVQSGAAGSTVDFAPITYDKPGTYTYTVTESGQVAGVTNDAEAATGKTVTVVVSDNSDGTMSAVVNGGNGAVTFTNTYEPAPTSLEIPVRKVLDVQSGDNAPDVAGAFTFRLADADGNEVATVESGASGETVAFAKVEYDKPGTYEYTVTEDGQLAGVTNDAEAATGKAVTVTVTDNGDGTLTAACDSTEAEPVTFTNKYSVASTTATIPVRKAVTADAGLTAPDVAGKFTFELTAVDGAPMPETTTATNPDADGGTVTFGDITYDEPGTYTYKVTESGQVDGITNDAEAATGKTVTVTVTDNGDGTLTATPSSTDDDPVTFTNTYSVSPATASFPVKKTLATSDGLTAPDITGAYTFALAAVDDAPMPATTTATNPSSDGGTVTFGDITYTKPGTYTYTVTESGTVAGVSNDSTASKKVTVIVTDNGDGTLTATPSSTDDEPLTFTNTYSVGQVQATISVEKNLESANGDNLPDVTGKFTFTLTDAEGNEVGTVQSGAAGSTVDFDPITYTKPGTYTYKVTESGQLAGVTNDAEAATGKTVTVVVSDNSDGTMSAVVNDGNGAVAFTNTYEPASTTATIPVRKAVTADSGLNAPDVAGKFTFELTAVDGAPLPETTTAANPDADGGTVTFGDITYTKPGTYTYKVTESGQVDGITNDAEAATGKTVTVTVTDNGDGTLTATPSSTADAPLTFTNHYSAAPATLTSLSDALRKTLEGRDWTDTDAFEFTMTATTDGAPMPEGSADGAKTITVTKPDTGDTAAATFGDITYAKPGTYTYEIAEANAGQTIDGVTYDSTQVGTVTMTVTVTDGGNGHLYAVARTDKATDFTNSYATGTTDVDTTSFQLKKVFTGKAWDGDEFSFTLAPVDNAPMPDTDTATVTGPDEANGTAAAFSFGTITYDKAGTYTYEVTENAGTNAGISYDAHKATVSVAVTDDGKGNLVAGAPVVADGTFTNTYSASSVTVDSADFRLTKVLEGRDWTDADSFEFTLAGADNAPMPATTTATVTKPADGNAASFGFGEITYDAPGTYTYTVTETQGSIGGITYDAHVANVTVTVTDNGQGQLVAGTAVVTGGTFTNTYSTTSATVTTADLGLQKSFTGRAWTGDEFSFTLSATTDGAPMPVNDTTTVTGPDEANGTTAAFSFGTIAYDAPGTYEYDIAETAGANAGITYDAHVAHLTVTVTDDGEGHLVASTKLDGSATFENSYSAEPTSVTLTGTKTLTNRQMVDGEFSFAVTDLNNEVAATARNAADGSLSFSSIQYTSEGLVEAVKSGAAALESTDAGDVYTFQYTVAEDTDSLPAGVRPVRSSFQVKVRVTDDHAGNLSAEVVYPDGGLAFENAYGADATAEVSINGRKILEVLSGNNPPDITGAFTFYCSGIDGAPLPERTRARNDSAGNVDFGKVTFTMDSVFGDYPSDAPRIRTYTYNVSESGTAHGVSNSMWGETITIAVIDNGDGTLSVDGGDGNFTDFTFTNYYSVQPKSSSVTDSIAVTKTLDGRDLAEGEFEFTLTDAQGNVVSTASNAADGSVAFDPITFEEPGTYTYTIAESAGDKGGVTYDAAEHVVIATVTDDSFGHLDVKWAPAAPGDANGIVFSNSYKAAPTSVTLTAAKVLEGRDLADGEFEFTLSQDGQVIQTVKNAADGSIAFEPVTFDAAGEYDLQLAEVKGADKNVAYDETVHTAHVTVTDDGEGHLTAEVAYDGDATPVFTNTYTAPAEPTPAEPAPAEPTASESKPVPVTGDATAPFVPFALAGMVLSGLAVARALRTRRN